MYMYLSTCKLDYQGVSEDFIGESDIQKKNKNKTRISHTKSRAQISDSLLNKSLYLSDNCIKMLQKVLKSQSLNEGPFQCSKLKFQ